MDNGILNMPEELVRIMNKAVSICTKYNTSEVSGAELLISIISEIDEIDKALYEIDKTTELLISSYEYLSGCGDFGQSKEGSIPVVGEWVYSLILIALGNYDVDKLRYIVESDDSYSFKLLKLMSEIEKDDSLDLYIHYLDLDLKELINILEGIYEAKEGASTDTSIEVPSKLSSFIRNMNDKVKESDDIYIGIDNYIDNMCNILCRKKKKNVCLVGESGVGKTSIVKAFVDKVNKGEVPDELKNRTILELNTTSLMAGTKFRGELEQKLNTLYSFLDKHKNKGVILFIDEIHEFINSGKGSESSNPIGNSLKPYLEDGTVCLIGTTTNKEYHSSIEKDNALKSRIQEIMVTEPSLNDALKIVSKSVASYENYHNVKVNKRAIESAVKLSDKYIKSEALPNKAFKIIDQACATSKIAKKKKVDAIDIEKVISEITGIGMVKLSSNDIEELKNLDDTLHKRLIGQDNAIKVVSKAIKRGKLKINDSSKPLASMLFVGPTGVGKTELCKVVSEHLFNDKEAFIRIDMSEYSEKYSTSKLIGSAPGYVGYGEGGQLTEKVKRHPNCLVLLDEIEKANPSIFDSFLQVLDDGRLTDGEGNTVDFKNSIIIMTSNAGYGADILNKSSLGFKTGTSENKSYNEKEKIAMKELERSFRPEFLNRIDNIVIFDKLTKEQCIDIAKLQLKLLETRMKENKYKLKFSDSVAEYIVDVGFDEKYGARNIKRAIQDNVEDMITDKIIDGDIKENKSYIFKLNDGHIVVEEKQ